MTRTTPPRSVDIAAAVPALAPLARTAIRLHPRPGNPTPQDSSVGGPLLWPASEPWPHCDGPHELDGVNAPRSPADVRLERRIRAAARGRSLTRQKRATIARVRPGLDLPRPKRQGPRPYDGSIAMLPLAQLYARDVPGLPVPAGADLLQVLWCPFDHPPLEYMPRTALFWRSAATVTDVLSAPPEPAEVQFEGYLPEPCTLAPERVTEYPAPLELDDDLRARVEMWCVRHSTGVEPDVADYRASKYQVEADLYDREFCVAPGWKVGGWIHWGLTDPYAQPCPSCGTPTEPLLTITGAEWDGGSRSWIPAEDRAAGMLDIGYPDGPGHPTKILIARGYKEIIRVCPASLDHPHVRLMQ